MKKLTFILSIAATLFVTACGNNTGNSTNKDSVSAPIDTSHEPATAIPDNSNATNPSIPDTAFQDSVPH